MKAIFRTLFSTLFICFFAAILPARAELTFLENNQFNFSIGSQTVQLEQLLPGDVCELSFHIINETDEALWYAVREIVCTGSPELQEALFCSASAPSGLLFSDSFSKLPASFQEKRPVAFQLPAGQLHTLTLVLRLDPRADNRIMAQRGSITIRFSGGTLVSESESTSENTSAPSTEADTLPESAAPETTALENSKAPVYRPVYITEQHFHRHNYELPGCPICQGIGPGITSSAADAAPQANSGLVEISPGEFVELVPDSNGRETQSETAHSRPARPRTTRADTESSTAALKEQQAQSRDIRIRTPKTGDEGSIFTLVLLMSVSLASALLLLYQLRK